MMNPLASTVAEPDFRSVAIAAGEAWVHELVRALRSDDREIIGAWPGTLREARMRKTCWALRLRYVKRHTRSTATKASEMLSRICSAPRLPPMRSGLDSASEGIGGA